MRGLGQNSVTLEDDIIVVTQAGAQTYETISALNEKIRELSKGRSKVKILVDYRGVTKVDIGARRAGFEVARHLPFDKMAFFGTSPYMTGVLNLILRASGRKRAVYFANNRQEAIKWLK